MIFLKVYCRMTSLSKSNPLSKVALEFRPPHSNTDDCYPVSRTKITPETEPISFES